MGKSMPIRLAPACILLVLLVGGPRAGAEDEAAGKALRASAPGELVARWSAETPQRRRLIEAELRRRGPAALTALRAVGDEAAEALRLARDRVIDHIRVDWHRRHLPAGMVYVPAGHLELARAKAPWGPRGERRWVIAFYIDRHEVTVGAWRAWLAKLADRNPGGPLPLDLRPPLESEPDDWPVARVSWVQAKAYAREARGGRLAHVDELRRALRGSGVTTYPWGAKVLAEHANLRSLGPGRRCPVGTHPRGASPFGVHDLVGNVAEWTADTRPSGESGWYPLHLGGSYRDRADPALSWCEQLPRRARIGPRERHAWLGLRVVRDVPPLPGEED